MKIYVFAFHWFSWFSYQFSWFSTNSLDFLLILLILLPLLLIFYQFSWFSYRFSWFSTNSLDYPTNSLDSPTGLHREQNGLKPRLTLKSAKLLGRPSRQLREKEEGSSPLTTTDWDSGCCSNQKSLRTDRYPGGPCRTRSLWRTTSTQKIG